MTEPNWNAMVYNPEVKTELQKLWALKLTGSQAEIRRQRVILRNMGFISLPFSMNKKK